MASGGEMMAPSTKPTPHGRSMFGLFRRRTTIIAEGLKIVGSVTAEGLVEVNGHIEGDLHCTSLVISPKASIVGGVEADRIVVNGRVEGPVRGGEVVLKAHAHEDTVSARAEKSRAAGWDSSGLDAGS